jgi:altronate dehydratase small subunit
MVIGNFMGYRAITINKKDNVATALASLVKGARISVEIQDRAEIIILLSDIPTGHKFALQDMEEGDPVIKYGEPIGQCTAKICRGEHVHVHNVISKPKERET